MISEYYVPSFNQEKEMYLFLVLVFYIDSSMKNEIERIETFNLKNVTAGFALVCTFGD